MGSVVQVGWWEPLFSFIPLLGSTSGGPTVTLEQVLPLVNWMMTVRSSQQCYLSCLLILRNRTGPLNPNDGIENFPEDGPAELIPSSPVRPLIKGFTDVSAS